MIYYLGNRALLERRLVGFLSSRHYCAKTLEASLAWVDSLDAEVDTLYCGAHSPLERLVVQRHLTEGKSAICVMARGIPSSISNKLRLLLDTNRLLLISPFPTGESNIRHHRARMRNTLIAETADVLFIGSLTPNGSLEEILEGKEWISTTAPLESE